MLIKRNDSYPVFSNLFGDFFDKAFSDWNSTNFSLTNTTLPAVNIQESKDDFLVSMAVPGMSKKDFKLDLNDNVLTISSEKKEEKKKEEENFNRKEYSYQSFSRSFTLPKNVVNDEKISAKYENGELKILIPKKEEAKPKKPKLISIN
ncbi:MAG: Hsp20/alpha crystallin family protein [Melioribacteraceae bacterium]|nr:Hsp20/alpha crystallin family protein [Melioribacteraceae bacterium]